jgi:nucleoside-diphosphate-sugar epimerase
MFSLPKADLENIAARLAPLWPERKTFLITGGTGFFGRWLVESIAWLESQKPSGNKYIVISRQDKVSLQQKISVLQNNYFEIIQQDLQVPFEISTSIDFVLHAASDVAKIKNSRDSDFSSLLTSTQNLIKALKPFKLQKFLYVSSGGVYTADGWPMKEEQLQLSLSADMPTYAEAKRQCEMEVRQIKGACSARCFSFVGPYVDSKMAVMDMLMKKTSGQSIVVNSPEVVRSFMYPTDLSVALWTLLLSKTTSTEYNIGSPQSINLLELAKKISVLGESSEVLYKNNDNEGSVLAGSFYAPDVSRYEGEFGALVTVDLETALFKTYNFLAKQENLA